MDGWLEHLRDDDLALLGRATGRRAGPAQVEALLADPAAYEAVFERGTGDPLLRASPFLVFALAVHRTAADLEAATFVPEWSGRQRRVAVFDAAALRSFLAAPARRLFLAELLGSYVHVASGSVWVQTSRGWRRRRYSELDPVRLATLLDVVAEAERPGVWRRLGDLALFLTGVFPDHADAHGFAPVQAARLLRAAGLRPADADVAGGVALLELLGRRWYRLARAGSPALQVVGEVADRFDQARRVLNLVTDRHLSAHRDRWFPGPGA
jgi:hypothetical protein